MGPSRFCVFAVNVFYQRTERGASFAGQNRSPQPRRPLIYAEGTVTPYRQAAYVDVVLKTAGDQIGLVYSAAAGGRFFPESP